MLKIALIPIDNRPICYDLIQDILSIHNDIKLYLPDISLLGGLTTGTDTDKLIDFINNLDYIDYLIVSLDTIAYGGLVPSRRSNDTKEEIEKRLSKFKNIARKKAKKIYAFSSIMRISNNNINEEEKEYWNIYGKKIFDWSYYLHKAEVEKNSNCVINKIPENILQDYLDTRKRNFEINKLYLEFLKEGFFDFLIFSKDDCAQFGLNVKEGLELNQIIKKENLSAKIKTGLDEIPLSLISRAIVDYKKEKININPVFMYPNSNNLISKYEDITINDCVLGQIELAGLNFEYEQGDLVLGDVINKTQKKIDFNNIFDSPCFVADVNNANGADVGFVEQMIENIKGDNFYGYCAYNTSANTIGCSILSAITKYFALKDNKYNEKAYKKLQFIRLMDDYIYQAIIRKPIREYGQNFEEKLKEKEDELNQYSLKIAKYLDFHYQKISYSLPWQRSFEKRIEVDKIPP